MMDRARRGKASGRVLASLGPLPELRRVPSEPIVTTGEVLLIYSERAFRVRLPNGKEVMAHPAKSLARRRDEIVPGAMVSLEMTPFDFEEARIAEILSAP
jgi:translation initiation factor IF-1